MIATQVLVAVLGAGAGSRMGGGKLGKDLGGRPLGLWALSTARGMGAPVVFIAPSPPPVWLDPTLPMEVVCNPDAALGMASSLILAARLAVERRAGGLLVMLADMPFIGVATLHQLVAHTPADGATACRYADARLGPAACFGGRRLEVLLNLSGDSGARHVLNTPGFAQGIAVAPDELMDVDTEEDLQQARLIARSASS